MNHLASLTAVLALAALPACAPGPSEDPGPRGQVRLENGSFTATLDGFRIHYEVRGRGPVLMTVPNSWGLTLDGLRGLYRPLEEDLTMVYFDPRGMGGSGPVRQQSDMGIAAVRADFDALRRHLGLGKVDAIGFSNGAMNLILLAAERPETLSSAIFLHGVARFSEEMMAEIAEKKPDLLALYAAYQEEMASPDLTQEQKDARTKEFSIEVYLPETCADPEAARPLLRAAFAEAGFSERHSAYSDVEMAAFDARDRLALITARGLVIAGEHDLLPRRFGEEIHTGLRQSTFALFEQSGHFSPLEEPERFRRTVLDFVGLAAGPQ